jgi:hypothetical protein
MQPTSHNRMTALLPYFADLPQSETVLRVAFTYTCGDRYELIILCIHIDAPT